MRINIATMGGRTHLLDTARELARHGHDVRFYSYEPTSKAVKFGLPEKCNYNIMLFHAPFLFVRRFLPRKLQIPFTWYAKFVDWCVGWYMKPCDVFIAQSPIYTKSILKAKRKYHALTILERGTSHVLEQINNLKDCLEEAPTNKDYIDYDMSAYPLADYVCIGAEHVSASFQKHGFSRDKLFVNNYGCNLDFFHPTEYIGDDDAYDVILVGTWSKRKGADLITEMCKRTELRFLHVGSLVAPFPLVSNMSHKDAMPEYKLCMEYARAKVFIMPSREEGLAQTQVQALVCGLPIVCSEHSGGIDLRNYTMSEDYIICMKQYTVDSLIECVNKALNIADTQIGKRRICEDSKLKEVSWVGYGNRYNEFLNIITNEG